MPVLILTLIAKFTLPFLFFIIPFQASWANYILDTIDGDILMHFGLDKNLYQTLDKSADYLTYFMMLLVGFRWKIKKTTTALFAYRSIGQILFFITRKRFLFFIFPNFLEPLFMIYSLLLFKYKDKAHKVYKKYIILIWIIVIGYKMWNEWNTNIIQHDLSTSFFGFSN